MANANEGDFYEEYQLEHVRNQPKFEHHGRCVKCLYWQSLKDGFPSAQNNTSGAMGEDIGECRFHAPNIVNFDVHWPKTHDFDWCGKFKARAGTGGLAAM